MKPIRLAFGALLSLPLSVLLSLAQAEETAPPAAAPAASPYTPPWQLRSVYAGTGARFDSAIGFYDGPTGGGAAVASMFSGSYRVAPNLALSARIGVTRNDPNGAPRGTVLTNPIFGALYSLPVTSELRAGFFLGIAAPIGGGGGNDADAPARAANSAAILARSAMDNSLFAANYLTVVPGAGLAYVAEGWTLQAEATLFRLTRVRGEKIDRDAHRTNFTSGLAAGYALESGLSLIGELRYQRWLENDTVKASANPPVQNLSLAVGPRLTLHSGGATMRPGIAYAQGLSGPIARAGYSSPASRERIVFLDLPIAF